MKIEAQWEDRESSHGEMGRAGYTVDLTKDLHSEETMKDQLEWKKARSLEIYARSPHDLRIYPSYCPCERQYSWGYYEKMLRKNPFQQNFPKIRDPAEDEIVVKKWLVKKCEDQ